MLAYPFDADRLTHRVLLTPPDPRGARLDRLLDACLSYDRSREHVTVVATAPWPEGRALIKAFGPEFDELGNVYAGKGTVGRAKVLRRKLRDLKADEVEWIDDVPLAWRVARMVPGWRGVADSPIAEPPDVTPPPHVDPTRVAFFLKSDLTSRAAHIGQAMSTVLSLVKAGATVVVAAPMEDGSFDDVVERLALDDIPRDRLTHVAVRPSRRAGSHVKHLCEVLDEVAARGFHTLYFRQVRVASMILPHARRLGMRVFLEAHHPYSTWAIYQRRKHWEGTPIEGRALRYYRALMRIDRDYERRVYGDCAGVLCTTEAMQRHVDRLAGAGKAVLLRNGAPTPLPPLPSAARDVDVIYTGMAAPTKGTDVLIEALGQLEDVSLRVIGGPTEAELAPYRELARAHGAGDRVSFHPWEAQDALFERIRRARVAVHPIPGRGSKEWRIYTCPLKIMEYMALGTPVVATDLPAIRELIEHGVSGHLVKPGDPAALAEGLKAVLGDPAYATRLRDEAARRVAEWSHERRAQRLLAALTREASPAITRRADAAPARAANPPREDRAGLHHGS